MDNIQKIYDKSGNLIEENRYDKQGDIIEKKKFNSDGKVLYYLTREYSDNKDIVNEEEYIYEYDKNGTKINEEYYVMSDLISSITFDEDGNKIKEKKAITSNWHFEILTYGKNGKIIRKDNEYYDEDILDECFGTTYEYDEKGNKIKEEDSGGVYRTYEYDENGNLIEEVHYREYSDIECDETEEEVTKVINYIINNEGIPIIQKEKEFEYYFNSSMDLISKEFFEKQYYQGSLLKEINGETNGNHVHKKYYNSDGILEKTFSGEYNDFGCLLNSYWNFHEENTSIFSYITSIDNSEDELYTPDSASLLIIEFKENGKLVERQTYIFEFRNCKRFNLRLIQEDTWKFDEGDEMIEHVTCNYRRGRREAYDSSGDLLWTDPIMFIPKQRGSIDSSFDNYLIYKNIKDPWGNLYTFGEEMWEDFMIKKSDEDEDEDGISLRGSDNFLNRAQKENDEETAEYEENDDYLCSESPNYDDIDSMEIRRDAWGNRYSLGGKMFDDYMNRDNKDNDYD